MPIPRFSESNTAFNALSRDLGRQWQGPFSQKVMSLVAKGHAAIKRPLDDPSAAVFQYGMGPGFEAVNELTASWGSGKSNRGALQWTWPGQVPHEVTEALPNDPARLAAEVKRFAARVGAVSTGIAVLAPEWIYSEVQRNHCSPEPPQCVPIQIEEAAEPAETVDGLLLPRSYRHVIVLIVPMDQDMILTAPSLLAEAGTSLGYSRAAACTVSVATFIRSLGYGAIPSLNGTGLSVPMAVAAGLGEAGRHGLLITPEYGACVRLAKVFTNMPLATDRPIDYGIGSYCETCGECARHCPSQAIPHGPRTAEGHNECNQVGTKWHVNAKRCLRYWVSSGTSCSVCIARCPFSLGKGWWLGLPQRILKRTTRFNKVIARCSRGLIQRKQIDPNTFSDPCSR